MKKLLLLALIALALMLVLSACEKSEEPVEGTDFSYTLFSVDSMPCVWAEGYKAGGLSCDWSKYQPGE